jgi:hypothetical protein
MVADGGIQFGGLTKLAAQMTQLSGVSTQVEHLVRSQDGHSAYPSM